MSSCILKFVHDTQSGTEYYVSEDSSFAEGEDLPEERFLQCATVLPDGRVFTAAGYDGTGNSRC